MHSKGLPVAAVDLISIISLAHHVHLKVIFERTESEKRHEIEVACCTLCACHYHYNEYIFLDRVLPYLARATKGYVGADLAALCREAATRALRRYRYSQ